MADAQPAHIVYSNVPQSSSTSDRLFAGKKFFISQRCPMRVHFVSEVTSNGGEVMKLEKLADFLIADQARKDAPPGSISYEFIEDSIKDGIVKEAKDYIIRPAGEVREVGSTIRPSKSSRIAYTAEDDRVLYEWVKAAEKRGDKGLGNKIYQDLEKQNPRHPWQSWRDRWKKYVSVKPPSLTVNANAPPSPPTEQQIEAATSQEPASGVSRQRPVQSQRAVRKEALPKPKASQQEPVTEVEEEEGGYEDDVEDEAQLDGTAESHETQGKLIRKQPVPDKAVRPTTSSARSSTMREPTPDMEDIQAEDFEMLMEGAWEIQHCSVKHYLQGWQDFAEEKDYLTKQQWRSFFEKRVMPAWDALPEEEQEAYKARCDEKQEPVRQSQKHFKEGYAESQAHAAEQPKDEVVYPTLPKEQEGEEDEQDLAVAASFMNFRNEQRHRMLMADPTQDSRPEELHDRILELWDGMSSLQQAAYRPEVYNVSKRKVSDDAAEVDDGELMSSPGKRRKLAPSQDIRSSPPQAHVPPQKSAQSNHISISSGEASESESDIEGARPTPRKNINTLFPRTAPEEVLAHDTFGAISKVENDIEEADEDDYDPDTPMDSTEMDIYQDKDYNEQLQQDHDGLFVSQDPSEADEEGQMEQDLHQPSLPSQPPMHAPVRSPTKGKAAVTETASPPLTTSEIDDYIVSLEDRAFEPTDILTALHRTCMSRQLTEHVLRSFAQMEGLPEDVAGIWTEQDDENLLKGHRERIEKKHGEQWCEQRRLFLRDWEEME